MGASRRRVPNIKNLHFRPDLRQLQIRSTCSNALHYFSLIKMTVSHFVGTGFLITYSYDHTRYSSIKEIPRLFLTKYYFFN